MDTPMDMLLVPPPPPLPLPLLPAVLRAHFHTVLQLQSQIDQGASVWEWNWLRKNHAGKKKGALPPARLLLLFYALALCAEIGLTIYLNCILHLSLSLSIDLSHLRWWNAREAAALPDWWDAKYVYHDQEMRWEFGQSSCISYARGHLSTAHW